jgi:hypothetical protein
MRFTKISSIFVLLGILIASLFSSCTSKISRSSSDYFEKETEIEEFTQIKLEGAYNIYLTQGDVSSLKVKTSEELHDKINIWVSDSMLHVKTNVKNLSSEEIKLFITFKDLSYMKIEGGAYMKTDGFVKLDDFNIEIEGGAHVEMKLTANKLKARAEGAVNMEFEGVTDEFIGISEGAGNIDADELKSRIVECRVSGVGNASVYATEKLKAKVEGLGKIGYRGNPLLEKQVDGIGIIYKK